jgi:hypothetical protein
VKRPGGGLAQWLASYAGGSAPLESALSAFGLEAVFAAALDGLIDTDPTDARVHLTRKGAALAEVWDLLDKLVNDADT